MGLLVRTELEKVGGRGYPPTTFLWTVIDAGALTLGGEIRHTSTLSVCSLSKERGELCLWRFPMGLRHFGGSDEIGALSRHNDNYAHLHEAIVVHHPALPMTFIAEAVAYVLGAE